MVGGSPDGHAGSPSASAAKIPPVQTPIEGLQIADTCFYYPEDRGISESVRLGKAMADALGYNVPLIGEETAARTGAA